MIRYTITLRELVKPKPKPIVTLSTHVFPRLASAIYMHLLRVLIGSLYIAFEISWSDYFGLGVAWKVRSPISDHVMTLLRNRAFKFSNSPVYMNEFLVR